jgi:hypothetical protein
MQVSLRCLMHAACRVWCVVCGVLCVAGSTGAFGSARQQATTGRRVILTRAANWRRGARRAPWSLRTSQAAARYLRYATLLGTSLAMLRLLGLACPSRVCIVPLAVEWCASVQAAGVWTLPLADFTLVRSSQRAVPSESYAGAYERPATRPRLHHVDLLPQHPPPARPSRFVRPRSGKCSGTRATSAPGLASRLRHLRRDRAPSCHICTGTGPTRATSAPELITSALGLGWPPEA